MVFHWCAVAQFSSLPAIVHIGGITGGHYLLVTPTENAPVWLRGAALLARPGKMPQRRAVPQWKNGERLPAMRCPRCAASVAASAIDDHVDSCWAQDMDAVLADPAAHAILRMGGRCYCCGTVKQLPACETCSHAPAVLECDVALPPAPPGESNPPLVPAPARPNSETAPRRLDTQGINELLAVSEQSPASCDADAATGAEASQARVPTAVGARACRDASASTSSAPAATAAAGSVHSSSPAPCSHAVPAEAALADATEYVPTLRRVRTESPRSR